MRFSVLRKENQILRSLLLSFLLPEEIDRAMGMSAQDRAALINRAVSRMGAPIKLVAAEARAAETADVRRAMEALQRLVGQSVIIPPPAHLCTGNCPEGCPGCHLDLMLVGADG